MKKLDLKKIALLGLSTALLLGAGTTESTAAAQAATTATATASADKQAAPATGAAQQKIKAKKHQHKDAKQTATNDAQSIGTAASGCSTSDEEADETDGTTADPKAAGK